MTEIPKGVRSLGNTGMTEMPKGEWNLGNTGMTEMPKGVRSLHYNATVLVSLVHETSEGDVSGAGRPEVR
jgi:hypothetical protein